MPSGLSIPIDESGVSSRLRSPFGQTGAARASLEFCLVAIIVVAIQAFTWFTQERINVGDGRGYDGQAYYSVAERLMNGERPRGEGRFIKRVGTPFLATVVDSRDLINGFLVVNVVAALVSTLLLLVWFRIHLRTWWLRVALVALFATHWLQLVRLPFFYPVLVDAWSQVLCFAGLILLSIYQRKPRRWVVVAITAVGALGVCFRELLLLVPVAFLFATGPRAQHREELPFFRITNFPRLEQWIPLIAACVALAWVSEFVLATDANFSPLNHLAERAYHRRLFTFSLGWMVAFGPVLFVALFDWRSAVDFFKRHPAFLVYICGVAAIGWAASLESERHALYWASPIVYLLAGRTIERHLSWFKSPMLVTLLLASHVLVGRLFLTTPQPDEAYLDHTPTVLLTPVGEHASYLHLFADYLTPYAAWIQLGEFAALGAAIIVWMSRRANLRSGIA